MEWQILSNLLVLLGLALFFGAVAERFKQSALIGYLIAGMLVGPGGLNLIGDVHVVEVLAELGVALLLFAIGLEFSLAKLKAMGALALGGGSLQIVLTGTAFALGARWFGLDWPKAIVIGAMVGPSSTACVVRVLVERAELDSVHGRNALGLLLLQDVALVPLVLIVTLLGKGGGWSDLLVQVAVQGGWFALFVGVFLVLSLYVIPRLLKTFATFKNRELLILLAICTALGAAWLAHSVGLSPALGAFIAGLLLGSSPFATQLRADISALRVLFVTLFFVSIGMLGNLEWIFGHWLQVIAAVAVLLAGKSLLIFGIALAFRQNVRNALATGICLAQVGEFSFVLGQTAFGFNLLSEDLFYLFASAALATMIVTPYLVKYATRAGDGFQKALSRIYPQREEDALRSVGRGLEGHVIVVGYGPAGREVVLAIRRSGIPTAVIELNPRGVEAAEAEGSVALAGDATDVEILEHVHLVSAKALVVAIPDYRTALAVVRQSASLAPHVPVVVRARYGKYAGELLAAGSQLAVNEEEVMGKEMAARVVELAIPESVVEKKE
ncbi:cation:proton antiporter [bacterium]|nr:cation:proton antiporter [bacterium]